MSGTTKQEIIEIVGKGMLAAIPIVGGSITSILSDIQAKRKEERLLEFLKKFDMALTAAEDRINRDYISQSDFLDLFELTAERAMKERISEKRIGFKNILVNSVISKEVDFDRTEEFIGLLQDLNLRELAILGIFNDPQGYHNEIGNPMGNNNSDSGSTYRVTINYDMSVLEVLERLLPKWATEDIDDAMHRLYLMRLTKLQDPRTFRLKTNGHPIHTLDGKLTEKGKQFVRFVREA